jgi:hypothetical protein
MKNRTFDRRSLRLAATLLLVGQLLYVVIPLLQPGIGEIASNYSAEFAVSGDWTVVHLGQFASMAGLFALFFALDAQEGTASTLI